jgi:DNA repair photolyase
MGKAIKGRGALSSPAGRFERQAVTAVDDGWTLDERVGESVATSVEPDAARAVITHNDSPDIPFDQSINPYRGCEHGCIYCLSGDTPILLADGTPRPLAQIRAGDTLYGTVRQGGYRRYVRTQVLAHWSVIKPAYRITLEDGTVLTAGADHRFLTERGWKFVMGTQSGAARRPHLTTGNKLLGTGAFAAAPEKDASYRRGYLCGLIRGAGLLGEYSHFRFGRGHSLQHQLRLALGDSAALARAQDCVLRASVDTERFACSVAAANRGSMQAVTTHARGNVERARELIAWPLSASRSWRAGFLAGTFDAEGSYSGGILRISHTDPEIIGWIGESLRTFDFKFVVEHVARASSKPIDVVCVLGGLREHLRLFHTVDPAISQKRDISRQRVQSGTQLGVASIEPLGHVLRLYDITTGTADFIANGVVSHNCYARPSHAYLGLSPGLDFETRLFFKANAAALLEAELARPRYVPKTIMLGANTDPYQPIERRLKVTRGILEVLARCRHPVAIITKGALIDRDLDLLVELARERLVRVTFSLPTLDEALKRVLEPRAASPQARLRLMRTLRDAGVPVGVMVAPVIPAVTDHELERVLEAAVAAGADSAAYVMLRLPYEVKDLFREWLDAHYPQRAAHVMSLVRQLHGDRDNDPSFGTRMTGTGPFAQLLRRRFQVACERLRLGTDRNFELDTTRFRPPRDTSPQIGFRF